jgi:sarcosine oxidase subunit beta
VDPDFRRVGYLFLASEAAHWSLLQSNARRMKDLGMDVALLTPEGVGDRWPFLKVDDLAGASYTEKDGYADPHQVLQGFAKGARGLGATLLEGVEVTGIETRRGRVRAVQSAAGETVQTPVVINAAGPYAAHVARMAGLELPVRPLRRQLFFTETFDGLPERLPMTVDLGTTWYMRREGKGLLLAGPQDQEPSLHEKPDYKGQEWAAEQALLRVPVLEQARIVRGWAGLYEISPDNHAIIGSFPDMEGFICANGLSGHGFMHSPAVGRAVAELVLEGRARTLDIFPLRPERFQEGKLNPEPLTAFRD